MTTMTSLHPLAAGYLDRLDRAARHLPRSERRELVEEIRAHLTEATDPGMSDAEVLTVLDRLGETEDIVAAERADTAQPADARGVHEWTAIFLLLFGGFVFGIGWIAGVILLWSSRAWNTRDKLIGTLVVPGGLATFCLVFLIGTVSVAQVCTGGTGIPEHCTGGPSTVGKIAIIVFFAVCLVGPILTSFYLARRAR
jgi:uncharacterized membrane protein